MKKLLLSLLFILGLSGAVWASVTFDTGTFTANYTEPSLNIDDTVLEDLDHTTIYYNINGGSWIVAKDVSATSLNGGGVIQEPFTVDLSALGSNIQANIEIAYTATDTSNNESVKWIEPAPIRIDQVSPKSPTG